MTLELLSEIYIQTAPYCLQYLQILIRPIPTHRSKQGTVCSHAPSLPCVEQVCHHDMCPVQQSCMQLFHIHPESSISQSKSERRTREPVKVKIQCQVNPIFFSLSNGFFLHRLEIPLILGPMQNLQLLSHSDSKPYKHITHFK